MELNENVLAPTGSIEYKAIQIWNVNPLNYALEQNQNSITKMTYTHDLASDADLSLSLLKYERRANFNILIS